MDDREKISPESKGKDSIRNLFDFFRSSPLVGADVDLDRQDDAIRGDARERTPEDTKAQEEPQQRRRRRRLPHEQHERLMDEADGFGADDDVSQDEINKLI